MNKRVLMVHSEMLRRAWPRMTPKEQEMVGRMHAFYEAQFRALAQTENLPGLAAGINDEVDRAVEGTRQASPSNAARVACRKGCAHCCCQHVSVSQAEAALLLECVRQLGLELDWELIERQAQHTDHEKWHQQSERDQRCAFLADDDSCRVYEHRPSMCRKHAALDNSEQCDTGRRLGGQVLQFVSIEAEVIASAAMGAMPWGTLPAMLLKGKE